MDERPLLAKAGPTHLYCHPLHLRRTWCWFLQRRLDLWHVQCTGCLSFLAGYWYWVRDIEKSMIKQSTDLATGENIQLEVSRAPKALEN